MVAVDNLEEQLECNITGFNREILEVMARFHLKRHPATIKGVWKVLKGKNYDTIRKTMRFLSDKKGNKFIVTLPDKKGKEEQFVLSNMQNVVSTAGICDKKSSDDIRAMENHAGKLAVAKVLLSLDNRPEPEFHHIFLRTELKDKEDYKRLLLSDYWSIPSDRNKGRVLERRLSPHRTCNLMAYPCGTVTIMISCSKQPFRWDCRDDWISLMGYWFYPSNFQTQFKSFRTINP